MCASSAARRGIRRESCGNGGAKGASAVSALARPIRYLLRQGIRWRTRRLTRFETRIDGVPLVFSVEDRHSKRWFLPRYYGGRLHEPPVTRLLWRVLEGRSCFVDVGAHLGWYACLAAKRLEHGRVYAFEMDAANFELLRTNLALNRCANVSAVRKAVGRAGGVGRYDRAAGPSSTLALSARGEGGASVEVVSLDAFLQRENACPDVVKIDVEGAELDVLAGMETTLASARPRLFVEVHPQALTLRNASVRNVLERLGRHGYAVFEIAGLRGRDTAVRLKPCELPDAIAANTMLYASVDLGGVEDLVERS